MASAASAAQRAMYEDANAAGAAGAAIASAKYRARPPAPPAGGIALGATIKALGEAGNEWLKSRQGSTRMAGDLYSGGFDLGSKYGGPDWDPSAIAYQPSGGALLDSSSIWNNLDALKGFNTGFKAGSDLDVSSFWAD